MVSPPKGGTSTARSVLIAGGSARKGESVCQPEPNTMAERSSASLMTRLHLGMTAHAHGVGVLGKRAEAAAELLVLPVVDVLVAKENHLVAEQRVLDLRELRRRSPRRGSRRGSPRPWPPPAAAPRCVDRQRRHCRSGHADAASCGKISAPPLRVLCAQGKKRPRWFPTGAATRSFRIRSRRCRQRPRPGQWQPCRPARGSSRPAASTGDPPCDAPPWLAQRQAWRPRDPLPHH